MQRDGYRFALICLLPGLLAGFLVHPIAAFPFLIAAVFCLYFFRDPARTSAEPEDSVVSPADGRVLAVTEEEPFPNTDGPRKKIAIFLSIFDVHVNRSPVPGRVEKIDYQPGRFLAAFKSEASDQNERNLVAIRNGSGDFGVVQIAGLLARRILCWTDQGDSLERGQKIGLIRFGSRVELYLPGSHEVVVQPGDRVRGGETVVARPGENL